jgi:acetyl/propionyl-CoA carboxylase alpha subunit
LELLDQPTFIEGGATTDYIDQHYPEGYSPAQLDTASLAAGIVLQQILAAEQHFASALSVTEELRGWVSTGPVTRRHHFEVGGRHVHGRHHLKQRRTVHGDADGGVAQCHIANA